MGTSRIPESERLFEPPFCPNRTCLHHRPDASAGWSYGRRGYRRVERAPGWIRRFVCHACGLWFSSSTFREDYWTKRPGLTAAVYAQIADGKGLRQAGRALGASATTVKRRQRWLAKQCLLQHAALMGGFQLREPVVVDGTRSFAGSRYEPVELNTWVCSRSGLHLALDVILLRRSGRMTPRQVREREQREKRFGRPDPRCREAATARGLQNLVGYLEQGASLTLLTDLEPDYVRAVLAVQRSEGTRVVHRRVSSKMARDGANPLFRVNQLHSYQRHSLANMRRRGVIAHSKDARGFLDRALIHRTFANMTKGVSERRADLARTTPAMRAGLADRPLRGEALFARRLFPSHYELSAPEIAAYERRQGRRPLEVIVPDVPKIKY